MKYKLIKLIIFLMISSGAYAGGSSFGSGSDARKCFQTRDVDGTKYGDGSEMNVAREGRNNQEGDCVGKILVVNWTQVGKSKNFSGKTEIRGAYTHLCSYQINTSTRVPLSIVRIDSVIVK